MRRLAQLAASVLLATQIAGAQTQGYGQYPAQQPWPGPAQGQPPQGAYPSQQGAPGPQYYPQPAPYPAQQPASDPRRRESSTFEIGTLYAAAVGYGIGMGVWFDGEVGVKDPALALIAPAVLGLAAPVGVYFLDQPSMRRGKPSAITAGLLIGAGEGLAIAGTQFVMTDKDGAWGFRGLGRSVALFSTLGGVGGYFLGEYGEPAPQSNALVMSGPVWGTVIGSALGYGISPKGGGYGQNNDSAAIGGTVGFNLGLAAAVGVSMIYVPSYKQLAGMWAGAGIGAAASLPVFLFYAGDKTPPAKRGLVFTSVAVTLGIAAGALVTAGRGGGSAASGPETRSFASLSYVLPTPMPGGGGISMGGILE